jgi:hypothetical protein
MKYLKRWGKNNTITQVKILKTEWRQRRHFLGYDL